MVSTLFFAIVLQICGSIAIPNSTLLNWQTQEIGVMISVGFGVEDDGRGCPEGFALPDKDTWNPTDLNTDQWVETALEVGAKYIVLVAHHQTGFALFPQYDEVKKESGVEYMYATEFTKWGTGKRDIVQEFMDSCKKYNVLPGLYYSEKRNHYCKVLHGNVLPECPLPGALNVTQEQFEKIARTHQEILWSRYGPLFEIWFDGGEYPWITEICDKLQPDAVKFGGNSFNQIRWIGNEEGLTKCNEVWSSYKEDPYCGNYFGGIYAPAESDTVIAKVHSWFWHEDFEARDLSDMQTVYDKTVGFNMNLLLNMSPNPRNGLLDDKTIKFYKTYGAWIKECYGKPVAEKKDHMKGSHVSFPLDGKTKIDRISIKEDLEGGQVVWDFVVRTEFSNGSNKEYFGKTIGNRRHVLFNEVVTPVSVELYMTHLEEEPVMKYIAAYCCSENC